jgi:hypothetical protein
MANVETCRAIEIMYTVLFNKLGTNSSSASSVASAGFSSLIRKKVHYYKHYVSRHYPSSCLYLKHCPAYFSKHNVLETQFCLHLQVKPTQLGPIDRARITFVNVYGLINEKVISD